MPQCAPPVTAVLFGLAAGAGALLRWQAGRRLPRPLATLAINVVGAFALGLLSGVADPVSTVVGIGGLGALTTFSTPADDLRNLWATSTAKAAAYVATTLILGIGAAAAGLAAVS